MLQMLNPLVAVHLPLIVLVLLEVVVVVHMVLHLKMVVLVEAVRIGNQMGQIIILALETLQVLHQLKVMLVVLVRQFLGLVETLVLEAVVLQKSELMV
jgi:hypothetical protein